MDMSIFIFIFAAIIISDIISNIIWGWIKFPKFFWLPGFDFYMFFEIKFYLIISHALYSWLEGPQYYMHEDGVGVSIGTWEGVDEWLAADLKPVFTGWVIWRPMIIYVPR